MKKTIAFFAVLIICLSYVSSVGQVFAAKDVASPTIIDLICLKKHVIADLGYNAALDYNEDADVNALDLTALRRILLGLPYTSVEPDDEEDSKFDDEGYNNEVLKP